MNNINWDDVKVKWEDGATSTELARDLPCTRQNVDKHAKRENWLRKQKANLNNWLEVSRDTFIAVSGSSDKRKPEVVAVILDNLSQGVSQGLAAKAAGISPDTLTHWKSIDPELVRLMMMAGSQAAATYVQRIHKAGKRDWRANQYLLEKHPETEGYSQKNDVVEFNFSFSRDPAEDEKVVESVPPKQIPHKE